jgi:hypothetical protein
VRGVEKALLLLMAPGLVNSCLQETKLMPANKGSMNFFMLFE